MRARHTAWIAAALVLAGCAGLIVTAPEPVAELPGPGTSRAFDYRSAPVRPAAVEQPQPLPGGYTRSHWTFTPGDIETDQEFRLHVDYFRGSAAAPRPLLIIVPIWGNGTYRYPSNKLSRYVRTSGEGRFDILQVLGRPSLLEWGKLAAAPTPQAFARQAEATAERVRLAVITLRRMVDWAVATQDIDNRSIFVVGFSMGAIVTSIALGNDDRFAGAVLVMGGAEFDRIFAYCHGRAGKVRNTITERFGWSTEQYRKVFERAFAPGQPGNFRGNYDPRRILMMDAMFDDCIPERSRETLWQALGRPERVTFVATHRMAFLAFTPLALEYGNRRTLDFLTQRIPGPETRYAKSDDDTDE